MAYPDHIDSILPKDATDVAVGFAVGAPAAGIDGAETQSCRRTRAVVWVLSAVGFVSAIRLMWWYWPGSFFNSAASGTWTALAWDFANGELYRPVLSPSGFGGTRYMPLLFVLHGLLIRLHIDPVHAGVLLMQVSVVVAAIALYVALRAAGVRPALALPFAATPWACVTYQKFCTDVRADYFAAAFVVTAVAAGLVATRDSRQRWLWVAGIACVLGAFSKFTAIVFVIPIAYALAAGSRVRAARFAAATLGAWLVLLAALHWASAGRFLDNFQAAVTGGTKVSDLWRHGLPKIVEELGGDPTIGAPFMLAVWSLVIAARRRDWSAVDSYFLTAALVTFIIYVSPGTASNHMIELQIATTVAVAVAVERGRLPDRVVGSVYALTVLVMIAIALPLSWMPSPMRTLRLLGPRQRATVDGIRAEFLSPAAPYLSLNPNVPLLLQERPVVLDAFNLNVFVVSDTPAGRDLRSRIRARSYATVIADDGGFFSRDSRPGDAGFAESAARFWAAAPPVVQLLGSDYEIRAVRRPFVIFQPRP